MPARASVSDADMDDAIQRYLRGEGRLSAIALSVGVGVGRLKCEMAARGVRARTKSEGQALRHVRDADSPWKAKFAAAAERSRRAWVYSPANRRRMAQVGREYGPRNSGRVVGEERLARRAETHQKLLLKVSPTALTVHDMLAARDWPPVLEQAAGRYNIDMAVAAVAVEIHRYGFYPLGAGRRRERQRTNYLCNRGWLVCYVWVRPADDFLIAPETADHIVALAEATQCDPSFIGQYRVIRGSGELVAAGRGDGDELT